MTHLDVFFGSRTGTAKELASDLANKASKRGVVVLLKEMNEFDPTHFDDDELDSYYSPSRATVFVVSTHYAGPAPNAEMFVQWLRFNLNWRHLFRNKRKKAFARLQYAVFGVGNSTYLTYNAMGKLIDARLHALGATRLCPLGLGD
ncbi:hypothetical protein PHYSODRAFT_500207, partial [Phytophthora sojae]